MFKNKNIMLFGTVLVIFALGFWYTKIYSKPTTPPLQNIKATTLAQGEISIEKNTFDPNPTSIKVGETITWINSESYGHDIVSDTGLFKSPKLATGEKFSFTFTKEGSYSYYCSIHPFMRGTVIVSNSASAIPNEISSLFEKLNKNLATNFVPAEESKFYSNSGYLDQKSWTVDFTSAVKEKAQIVIVKSLLGQELNPDVAKSAGGAGQTVDAYNGKSIVCYLLLGLDKKDILTCSIK